jgi:hypothetical protein
MRRASVTLTDDLEKALEAYRRDQEIPPGLTAVMQAALREYLVGRGYLSLSTQGALHKKPKGVPKERRARIEGPNNVGAAVIEDRR